MDFVSFANSLNAGDRPRVDFEQISVFPLPPYSRSYQHRIVAKIEELFSELDAGEESLRLARKKLSVYRQSLLKQAFEGKLTEHWRKQNPHLLESPDELLNRIQEERQARYVDQLKYWQDNRKNGKKVSKPKRPEYATAIPDEALTALPQMPIGWLWCLLGTVCEFANGDRGKNYPNRNEYVAQGIPWINTGHIEPDGSLSSDRMNFITREKFESLSGGRIQPTA
jgi:type I restriction enzyme S subunit